MFIRWPVSYHLRLGYVLRLQASPTLTHLVGHPLALLEVPEPGAFYGGEVHEDLLAPVGLV
jgi:hypothetical protein